MDTLCFFALLKTSFIVPHYKLSLTQQNTQIMKKKHNTKAIVIATLSQLLRHLQRAAEAVEHCLYAMHFLLEQLQHIAVRIPVMNNHRQIKLLSQVNLL